MQMGMVNLMTAETRVLNEFDYNIRRNCILLSIKDILGIQLVLTYNYSNRSNQTYK
jgi:hypothetical protein